MLLDKQTLFSNGQNLAQGTGNYLSDNSIDLGSTGTDFHGGTPPSDPARSEAELFAQVTTTFTSGGAATLQAQLVSADDAGLTTNLTVLEQTDAIPVATLVQGYRFRLGKELPVGIGQRYIGLRYVIGTAAMTAGNVTAGLAVDVGTARIN